MKALFNNNLVDVPLPVMPDNRAFQFGDGFFETIWFRNGSVPLIRFHRDRIFATAKLLRLEINTLETRYLPENIETLRDLNLPDEENVVAKMMFWRHASERAGYWADQTTTDSLLIVRPYVARDDDLVTDFCNNIRIAQYPWSTSKNLNALPYVMASMECRDKDMDELILSNQKEEIAEGITSNLFIRSDDQWFTPELSSGCVAGTMRAYILDQATNLGIRVRETRLFKEDMTAADSMLMTRSTGLGVVKKFGDKQLDTLPANDLKKRILKSLK